MRCIGHCTISAACLQHGMIDAGIGHLGQHQLRRCFQVLHADGHVLGVVVLAIDGEFKLAEAADAEVDIAQSVSSRLIRTDQRLGVGRRSVACTIGARHRASDHALQVFHVQVACWMATAPIQFWITWAWQSTIIGPFPDAGRRCGGKQASGGMHDLSNHVVRRHTRSKMSRTASATLVWTPAFGCLRGGMDRPPIRSALVRLLFHQRRRSAAQSGDRGSSDRG